MLGIDYAFSPHPSVSAIKASGAGFVCRYISSFAPNDSNGKNLLPAECKTLLAAGLKVVVVVEEGADRMKAGHSAGAADASHAVTVTTALHMGGVPVYFACDFDATPGDQAAINAYLDGAASVIGRARTGIYGGYWPLSRAMAAGKAHYGWQTLAWSGGFWNSRAGIRQGLGFNVGGVSVDVDHSTLADFGQWPRPKAPVPVPVPPSAPAEVEADGKQSWREIAHAHGCSVIHSVELTLAHQGGKFGQPRQAAYAAAGDWNAPLPGPVGGTPGVSIWVG